MHKRIVNQAIIKLEVLPAGPLLIKASDQGADPTKPDMEFVETYHAGESSVYLPGSSLKGAIRAHCERIVRTLGSDRRNNNTVWACDPLTDRPLDAPGLSCSKRLDEENKSRKRQRRQELTGSECYATSCTACRLFGNTVLASHIRIADAYPVDLESIRREERNGVAIDRIYGSVAAGPFNFEVLTEGKFTTTITVKNFTTAQLALIALAIRDFDEQRVGIGFAKSRGLGQVNMKVKHVEIRYPTTIVEEDKLQTLGYASKQFSSDKLVVGAGEFVSDDDREAYAFPKSDIVEVEVSAKMDEFDFGATLKLEESDHIITLWRNCVSAWGKLFQERR